MTASAEDSIRIDKWLWAARFFKTRAVAAQAVTGGKVKVNGERAKASKVIRPGDALRIHIGPFEHAIQVLRVSARRGPAKEAVLLYAERAESKAARAAMAAQLRADRSSFMPARERPSKHARRELIHLKQSGDR